MDPQRNYSSVRLWSYRSIYELLTCFSVTSVPLRLLGPALNKIFNDCVPRLCIDYNGHNWGGKAQVEEPLNVNAISYKFCLIYRLERTSTKWSRFLLSRLSLDRESQECRPRTNSPIQKLCCSPATREMSGDLFEG
jgi:hypothetical protein